MKLKIGFFLICLLAFLGCNRSNSTQGMAPKDFEGPLIDQNQKFVEVESERIDAFVKRRGWKVRSTGTGLRYFIYETGDPSLPLAAYNQIALVNFEISLLDGTICYSSKEKGAQSFKIGRDNVESGLHEGITFLRPGDKAKLILPAHLAHGLLGDRNKIPPKSVIIYDIELLALK